MGRWHLRGNEPPATANRPHLALTLSVVRGGHHADLRQEAEPIFLRPLLHELAIDDAVDGDRGHLQVIARTRGTGEIAFVFADRGQAGHDLFAFCNLA
jgi:hypothetical protein